GDDDDATGDDDDATGDDDDATGDDDDSTAPGVLIFTADLSNLGNVSGGSSTSTNLYFENAGGMSIVVQLTLSDLSGAWQIPGSIVNVAPFSTESRALTFNAPVTPGTFSLTVNADHDGSNPSPQQLVFSAMSGGGGAVEGNCTDNIDNDSDGNTDCADSDCSNDPACTGGTDLCCNTIANFNSSNCNNQAVWQCICNGDSFCCTGWDSTCADFYVNGYTGAHGSGSCSPSGTCGP
ncbi:MAG: hypothetical protein KDA24_05190, partial [Deltaproteobacteria bacterium]|nr:hypothetical protein [Deltaproteobacteria bacterium]